MAGKRGETLLDTMFFIERFTLQRAWTDVTDEEFFWEPVDGSWSVRPRAECTTPTPFGSGDWVADFDGTIPSADWAKAGEPLTTMGWLFWHIGSMPGRAADLDFLGGSKSAASGWTSPYLADHPVFTSAKDAIDTMRDGWRNLERAMHSASDEQLETRTRFWGYGGEPGPEAPGHKVLASILNEISHHGSQIGTMRDFYKITGGGRS